MADAGGRVDTASLAPGAMPTPPPTPSGSVGLLAAGDEPASAGAAPLQPDIVERAAKAWRTRRLRPISGPAVTGAVETAGRPAYTVRWSGLSRAEAALVDAFLRDETLDGVLAFTARVDGDQGAELTLRLLAPPTVTQAEPGAYVVEAPCEAVRTAHEP